MGVLEYKDTPNLRRLQIWRFNFCLPKLVLALYIDIVSYEEGIFT